MHQQRAIMAGGLLLLSWFFPSLVVALALLLLVREVVFDSPIPELVVPPLATGPDPQFKDSKPAKKVCVVTGAAGFVGKNLVKELAEEGRYEEIRAVDIVLPRFSHPRVKNIRGNILDEGALLGLCEGAETVFHVASLIDLREEPHRRHRLHLVNVLGCRNVVNACIRRGVSKLVYTSSTAAVFDGRPGMVGEEDYLERVPLLKSTYGVTKREGERLVLSANGLGSLKTVALRPYLVFGEDDNYILGTFSKNRTSMAPEHRCLMSTMYVGNLVHWELLAERALDTKPEVVAGRAYFVSDDDVQDWDKRDFDRYICEILGLDMAKDITAVKPTVAIVLGHIMVALDWFTCGKLEHTIMQLSPNMLHFSWTSAQFNIARGIKDLGYATRHSRDQIKARLKAHYKTG